MFESALLTKLRSDATLLTYVEDFIVNSGTVPAIFSDFAPESASMPYVVFRISQSAADHLGIMMFNVYIDYYDYNKSASNARKAVERIQYTLDRAVLEHSRFGYIRLYFFDSGKLEEADPRSIRYNMQFTARAGKSKWMTEIS